MFFFLLHRRVNKGTGHYLPPKGERGSRLRLRPQEIWNDIRDEDDLRMESFHFQDDRSYRGGGGDN